MAGRTRSGRSRALLAGAAAAAFALSGCGLTAPRGNEGFADLDSLGVFDVDNTLTLSIGPSLLRFAAAHVKDDPETEALLSGLEGVRVRLYTVDESTERVAGRLERMSDGLRRQGWAPVALVRENDARVHMLVKTDGARIAGLTVLSLEGREAVVVNVMGDLRPEFFSDTMAALDVDAAPRVQVAAAP